jgi:hypothetical protein
MSNPAVRLMKEKLRANARMTNERLAVVQRATQELKDEEQRAKAKVEHDAARTRLDALKSSTPTFVHRQAQLPAPLPTTPTPRPVAHVSVHENILDKPYASFGEQLLAIRKAASVFTAADIDPRLRLQERAPSGRRVSGTARSRSGNSGKSTRNRPAPQHVFIHAIDHEFSYPPWV